MSVFSWPFVHKEREIETIDSRSFSFNSSLFEFDRAQAKYHKQPYKDMNDSICGFFWGYYLINFQVVPLIWRLSESNGIMRETHFLYRHNTKSLVTYTYWSIN